MSPTTAVRVPDNPRAATRRIYRVIDIHTPRRLGVLALLAASCCWRPARAAAHRPLRRAATTAASAAASTAASTTAAHLERLGPRPCLPGQHAPSEAPRSAAGPPDRSAVTSRCRARAPRSRRRSTTPGSRRSTTRNTNVQIDYQANGSGAGITAITQQTVDFGASDAAMKDEEIAALKSGTKILHIPTALGAVVVDLQLPRRRQAPARLGQHGRDLPGQRSPSGTTRRSRPTTPA